MNLREAEDAYRAKYRRDGRPSNDERVVFARRATEIAPEPVRFLWEGRFPLGALSLVAGEGGLGKSTLLIEKHARLSRGTLEGEFAGAAADSLIVTSEDHAASVVIPRLIAADADLERVHIVGVEVNGTGGLITFPDDLPAIEDLVCRHEARLLSVDPVVGALSGAIDSHKDHSIRRVLAPLAQLAERRDLAIAGVIHMNKSAVSDLLNRVSGSKGFVNAARSVLVFARDPDDPDGDEGYRRVIVHAKANWARLAPSLAAEISSVRLEPEESGASETIFTSQLVITGESEITKADITRDSAGEGTDKTDLARHWLLERLIPGAWHNSGEIKAEAEEAGHKTRTLKRAFGTLLKEGAGEVKEEGFPRHTYWRIHSGAKGSDETDGPNSGPTGQTRILEPKTPQSAPQWGQTPRLAPLEQKETCECARPARSPRAVGRDFCRTCRRPIAGTE